MLGSGKARDYPRVTRLGRADLRLERPLQIGEGHDKEQRAMNLITIDRLTRPEALLIEKDTREGVIARRNVL